MKRNIMFATIFLIISSSSLDNILAQYSWKDTTDLSGNFIRMKVNNKTGAPHLLYGLKVNFSRYGKITEQNVDELSRQFLTEHANFLKVQPEALYFDKAINNKGSMVC